MELIMLTRRGLTGFASFAISAFTGFVATDASVNASDRDQQAWGVMMPVVRISLGHFDAANYDAVRRLLDDSQKTLIPEIRGLKGNRAYYVGIDRENNAMTNVSVWDTRGDAEQMATLQPMLNLAKIFVDAGVRFERPITNHEILWTM
jgi:hypothetical protein